MLGSMNSRFAAASRVTQTAAMSTGRRTRVRVTPAARQRGHFVVALNPRDREHDGDERHGAASAVEENDRLERIVGGHRAEQVAMLLGVVDEMIEMAEGVDHDVETDEAHQADHKDLDELAQHVAVDNRGHRGEG